MYNLNREIAKADPCFTDTADDLVLHIGDVHDVFHGEALELQVAPDQIRKDKRPEVTDVREVVNGRAAAIHADGFSDGIEGTKFLNGAGQRVK